MVLLPGQHSELKHCKSMPFHRPNKPTYKGGQPLPKDIVIRTVNTIDLEFQGDGTRTSSESYRDSSTDDHSHENAYPPNVHRRPESNQSLVQSKSAAQLRPKPQPLVLAARNDNPDNPFGMSDVDAAFMKKTFEYLEKIGRPLPMLPHVQRAVSPPSAPWSARSTPSPLYSGPPRAPPRQQVPRTPPGVDFPSRSGSPDSCYSQESYRPSPTAIDRELDRTEKALAQFWPPTPKVVSRPRQFEGAAQWNGPRPSKQNEPERSPPRSTNRPANFTGHTRAPPATVSKPGPPRALSPEFYSTPPLRTNHTASATAGTAPTSARYPSAAQSRSRTGPLEPPRHQPSKLREETSRSRLQARTMARNESSDSSDWSSHHTGSLSSRRAPRTTEMSSHMASYSPPPRAEPGGTYFPPPSQAAARPAAPVRAHTANNAETTILRTQPQPRSHIQPQPQTQAPTRFSPFAAPSRPVAPRAAASEPSIPSHSQRHKQLPPVQTSQALRTVQVTVHHSKSVRERLVDARVAEFGVIPAPPSSSPSPPPTHSQSQSQRRGSSGRSRQEQAGPGRAYTAGDYTRRAPHRM